MSNVTPETIGLQSESRINALKEIKEKIVKQIDQMIEGIEYETDCILDWHYEIGGK